MYQFFHNNEDVINGKEREENLLFVITIAWRHFLSN